MPITIRDVVIGPCRCVNTWEILKNFPDDIERCPNCKKILVRGRNVKVSDIKEKDSKKN